MYLKPFKEFTIQFHITNKCKMHCKHCYIDDSVKGEEISIEKFGKSLKNYINFLRYHKLKGKIYFTGGDPLLHKNFWDILKMANKENIAFAIMGNYHLLNEENIKKLKKYNIHFYQLSLEGTKKTHESIRGKGNFQETIEAIELLESNGIKTIVNTTLSNQNINDIIPLIKILSRTSLSRFDFVRIVPIGRGVVQKNDLTSPMKFKNLLLKILKIEQEIKKYNNKLQIGKKDHLWKLLYFENNKLRIDLSNPAYGCGMGYRHLTILPNGDILLCRKIDKKIGNILNNDLISLYKNNDLIKKILKNNLIKNCLKCNLKNVCRGCPAVGYALYKSFEKADPQCWLKCN